jgi:purine nucleosidase
LTVVATGPLTNLALAVTQWPALASLVRQVVVMGGVIARPGNVGPLSEANIANDPEAAQIVLRAGWPVTLVGLDATLPVSLSEAQLDRLAASGSPAGRHLRLITPLYIEAFANRWGRRAAAMHDALALAVAVQPALITVGPSLPVTVELTGQLTRGMTVADRRPQPAPPSPSTPLTRVVLALAGPAFVDEFSATLRGDLTATCPAATV